MQTLLQDFRFSLRQLFKSPGFSLTAIISLALGIGATTAVFSVIYAILMNPYPYAAPDRMAHMRLTDPSQHERGFGLTGLQFRQIQKSPVVEDAFISDDWSLTVTGRDLPEDIQGVYMTSNAFTFFGVPPLLGRGLVPSDSVDGQEPQPVAVLGYKFWLRHFNGDPKVVGQTIQLVRKNYTIVGVVAPRFTWDDGDVYLPLKITSDPVKAYYVGLRLKPGVTHQAANATLTPLIQQFAKESPTHFPREFTFHVVGLNDNFVKDLGGTLSLLFTAVALLLVIACGNVSILLLARGTVRQHEMAIRTAIGASRGRIIRQLLTESLLLSLTGTALGVLLAYRTLQVIVDLLPKYSFPHEASIAINLPVLIFSAAVALLTGLLFGLSPALQLSRPQVSQVMQASTRKIAGTVRGRTTHNVLTGAQIALTLVMLAGAGAAMEGFLHLIRTPLGYDPHNIMSVGIPVHEGAYPTWEQRLAYFEELHNRVATVRGATMTAMSSNATPPSNGWQTGIEFLGMPRRDEQQARINFVSPGYFPILRIPLVQGRIWDETENHRAAHVVVINQTMAKLYFPAGDALGHSLRIPDMKDALPYVTTATGASDAWLQIIGISADKLDDGLSKPILPEAFLPYTLSMRVWTQILVRADSSPLALLHSIAAQVNAVDPEQQINGQVADLDQWIREQQEYRQGQMVAWLFGAFAVLALALAAVGLYSVVSYSVAQRTNEFGIRMALGAQRAHVLKIVFASTILSVGSGLAAGLLLTLALNKVLARWAENTSRDPIVLFAVTVLLLAVASVACAAPARRAIDVDPMTALRYE